MLASTSSEQRPPSAKQDYPWQHVLKAPRPSSSRSTVSASVAQLQEERDHYRLPPRSELVATSVALLDLSMDMDDMPGEMTAASPKRRQRRAHSTSFLISIGSSEMRLTPSLFNLIDLLLRFAPIDPLHLKPQRFCATGAFPRSRSAAAKAPAVTHSLCGRDVRCSRANLCCLEATQRVCSRASHLKCAPPSRARARAPLSRPSRAICPQRLPLPRPLHKSGSSFQSAAEGAPGC